jgi:hypothetical protein
MIDALIFSKNRAAQLDLLLRSIDTYARGLYRRLSILCYATSPAYAAGYQLAAEASPDLDWIAENDFELDTRTWLADAGPVVSFLVDDDLFYAEPDEFWVADLPLSLRGGDYDYPFSLDGNVYLRRDVLTLLASSLTFPLFTDPTQLEALGHDRRERLPFERVNESKPCLVGVPANRVSRSSGVPHLDVDPFMLNERYLGGERLIAVHDGSPLPAHAELEYVFSHHTTPIVPDPLAQ